MINFGRAVGLFNRFSPKISKGIGQVAHIARNVGQAVQNVRNIGSTVNAMSGGRIGYIVTSFLPEYPLFSRTIHFSPGIHYTHIRSTKFDFAQVLSWKCALNTKRTLKARQEH